MITKTFRLLTAIAAGVAFSAAQGTPTLLVSSGGILTGADGVLVDGVSYDVRFVDGSCDTLFGNCSPSAFAFSTMAAAADAAHALFDTVLVDGPLGNFASIPGATSGCVFAAQCSALIPWSAFSSPGGLVTNTIAADHVPSGHGFVDSFSTSSDFDTSTAGAYVWAVFNRSASVAAVPEPASVALLFAGAGAWLAFARKRRARCR